MATINLSIQKEMLSKVEAEANKESCSKSELLMKALRVYLERKKRWTKIFNFSHNQARRNGLTPKDFETAILKVRSH